MTPPDRFAILALLRNSLSPGLITALSDSFKLSLIARSNITVELFLVSLYKSSPQELAAFFVDPQPLENRLQQLSSIDVASVEIASPQTPGSGTRGYNSTLDQSLVDLLSQAASDADRRLQDRRSGRHRRFYESPTQRRADRRHAARRAGPKSEKSVQLATRSPAQI